MASRLYFRNTFQSWNPFGTNGKDLESTPGNSVVQITSLTSQSGFVAYSFANASWMLPMPAITISGTITVKVWMSESANTANGAARVTLQKITRPSAAQWGQQAYGTTTFATLTNATELAVAVPPNTPATAVTYTGTPTSTTFNHGDLLAIAPGGGPIGSIGSGRNIYFWYNGAANTLGDSYVEFTENFTRGYKRQLTCG